MARDNGERRKSDLGQRIVGDGRKLAFVVLVVLSVGIGGTLAYISSRSDTSTSAFTSVSAPAPVIVETTSGGSKEVQGSNEVTFSSKVATKRVQVRNIGATGYLRVRLTLPQQTQTSGGAYVAYDMKDTDQFGFVASNAWVKSNECWTVTVGDYTLTFDKDFDTNWAYANGWFYYRHLFKGYSDAPNNITAPLLTSVTANTEAGYTVEVGVVAETLERNVTTVNTTWSGANYDTDTGEWS